MKYFLDIMWWKWYLTSVIFLSKTHVCWAYSLSHVRLFATWTVACQAPLSMGILRQEYWSGLSFPSPGDLSNPGIKSRSPTLQADSLSSEPPGKLKPITLRLKIRKTSNSNKGTSYKTSQNYQGHQKIQEMFEKLKAKKILRRHDN